ncbi:DUF2550 domain-containing protein [Georgenia sp. TF02-10]|uniref:DUF2550 family protein n=1 Tax=Georgenia sp. TF02-10 TaxID=2917725 RepID=UPI001FA7382D|nr:DUF2550 family protein [Georgenia sp. TF02-10]UNX53972.1 DUF2550 domain-containing protein [Georgenia sp. TF02-10]
MTAAEAAGAGLVVAALAAVVVLVLFAVRVRRLARRVGSFECARRRPGQQGWTSGIAVFGAGKLYWYRLVSLSLRPACTFARAGLQVVRRTRRGTGAGHVVEVRCRYQGRELDLAMVDSALAGVVSWLESAPPLEDPVR